MKLAVFSALGAAVVALSVPMAAHAYCFEQAEARYWVNRDLLRAIAQQESGMNPRAINRNKNGSMDVGLMQINSTWFPLLAKYGVDKDWLFDPCYNVMMGAWILAKNIDRYGVTWKAVGAYNAVSPEKQTVYARKIEGQLGRILRGRAG